MYKVKKEPLWSGGEDGTKSHLPNERNGRRTDDGIRREVLTPPN